MDIEETLAKMRQAEYAYKNRRKKKKNQTKADFLIQKARYTCTYCEKRFEKKKHLCVIRKDHTLEDGQIFESKNNRIVACRKCASQKGNMNHKEFLQWLAQEKRRKRQEIVRNYPYYARKVFRKYNGKCIYCEFEYGHTPAHVKLTIDHKDPISRLGENEEKNFASACEEHNFEKGNRTADEYFSYLEKQGRKHKVKKVAAYV